MRCHLVLMGRQSVKCLGVEEQLVALRCHLFVRVVDGRGVSLHVCIQVLHRCIVHDHGAAVFHREEVGVVSTLRRRHSVAQSVQMIRLDCRVLFDRGVGVRGLINRVLLVGRLLVLALLVWVF